MEILHRPRRLRINENIRELARETRLSKSSLIYPVFIREGSGIKEEIPSLVNQYHYSPDRICEEIEQLLAAGIQPGRDVLIQAQHRSEVSPYIEF